MPLHASSAALKSIAFMSGSKSLTGEEPTPEMEIPMPSKPHTPAPAPQMNLLAEHVTMQTTHEAAEAGDPRAAFSSADVTMRYLLAGHAIVTFQSKKTGTHFTYSVETPNPKKPKGSASHFVKILTGPDQYTYLGCVFGGKVYAYGRNSTIGSEAPSAKAFMWVWKKLSSGQMPEALEVYHEGRCGRCGRRLTTPESVSSGIGPECAKKMEGG